VGMVGRRVEDREAPFSREALFRTVGPIVGMSFMALLYSAKGHAGSAAVGLILQAATLTTITVAGIIFIPWKRLPGSLQATPPLVFLIVAFLAREATGGAHSIYGQLVLLPVVWLGVYGTPAELAAGLLGVTAALVAPLLQGGATQAEWRHTLSLTGIACALGVGVEFFFQRIRSHTDRLASLAWTDHLTGVPNRRAWDEELQRALESSRQAGRPLCVAMLDLDHFKDHNDRFGHPAGDQLLSDLAFRWKEQIRGADILARLGGDEFALIISNCRMEAALSIVRRLCTEIPCEVTCSAGIAAFDGAESAKALVARADRALYEAKDRGRDCVIAADSVLAF
jgi:diguanylate cyclase (GGDEF)-like protein